MSNAYYYDYLGTKKMEAVEESTLDRLTEKFNSNVKDTKILTVVDDSYKNFVVTLEDCTELDIEMSFIKDRYFWAVTVWLPEEVKTNG